MNNIFQLGTRSLVDFFDDACEGIVAIDARARIVRINDKYATLLGLNSVDEALGREIETLIPNSRMREVVESGKPILLDIMTLGAQRLVVMRLPIKEKSGQVVGAVGFALYDGLQRLNPLMAKFSELQSALANTRKELAQLRRTKYSISNFIGASSAALELKHHARRAAQLDTTVLLMGETGTGKELLAHGIHAASGRAAKPFVGINIAAIPEPLLEAEFFGVAAGAYTGAERKGRDGKFKIADGGTLFLDEVGDMPMSMQAKLLRALQEQEIEPLGSNTIIKVDVRVIAATSRNVKQLVAEGKFRPDLYYRLNVLPIVLPPLRERITDLDALCEHLLAEIAMRTGLPQRELTDDARKILAAYRWPGNVRELRNAFEHAGMLTDNLNLSARDFSAILPASGFANPRPLAASPLPTNKASPIRPLAESIAAVEKDLIQAALQHTADNKMKAARLLGISRATLYSKMLKFALLRKNDVVQSDTNAAVPGVAP